jgi:hypothetical protein
MPRNPQECRQRALMCANRATTCTSPAASQKFADQAIVWLMLAVQFEEQASIRIAPRATPDCLRSRCSCQWQDIERR